MVRRRPLNVESLEARRLLAITTVEVEPNDAPSAAQVFEFGDDGVAILQGNSASKDDRDFFRFTAPEDGYIDVSLPARGASLELDDLLELEPHDGVTEGSAAVLAGRSYVVRLRGAGKTAADYEATIAFTPGVVPPGTSGSGDDHGGEDDHDSEDHGMEDHHEDHDGDDHPGMPRGGTPPTVEDPAAIVITDLEPNNTRASSQQFELLGSTRLEGAASKSDRDFFAFTVPADGLYTVGVRSLTGGEVEVEIEDQFGHEILELEPHDGISSGAAAFAVGRTYFLRVKSESMSEASYAVDLQPLDASTVDPASLATTPMSAQKAIVNQLDNDGDDVIGPLDALNVINYLNSRRGHSEYHDLMELVLDMNDDGSVGPIDALMVINYLNMAPAGKPMAPLPAAITESAPIDAPLAPAPVLDAPIEAPVDPLPLMDVVPPPYSGPKSGPGDDDPSTHDLYDDHGVDTADDEDEIEDESDDHSDVPAGTSMPGTAFESKSGDDDDDYDDYEQSVDDWYAEFERESEHLGGHS